MLGKSANSDLLCFGSFLPNFFSDFAEKYNEIKDKEGKGFLKKNNSH